MYLFKKGKFQIAFGAAFKTQCREAKRVKSNINQKGLLVTYSYLVLIKTNIHQSSPKIQIK